MNEDEYKINNVINKQNYIHIIDISSVVVLSKHQRNWCLLALLW